MFLLCGESVFVAVSTASIRPEAIYIIYQASVSAKTIVASLSVLCVSKEGMSALKNCKPSSSTEYIQADNKNT